MELDLTTSNKLFDFTNPFLVLSSLNDKKTVSELFDNLRT